MSNYFLIAFLLVYFPDGISSCDTKWIRFVYMMSCGKRKRESIQNETFFENLPNDFEGALEHLKEYDPFHPFLINDALFARLAMEDDEPKTPLPEPDNPDLVDPEFPMLFLREKKTPFSIVTEEEEKYTTTKKPSIFVKKLIVNMSGRYHSGIPGFPDDWDIEEITDDKINENHRREIDRLIEECCKVPPVSTCNGNTFLGACK